MPRSSGTFTAPSSSVNPAVEGSVIDEVDFNALVDDIESGLTESTYTAGLGSTDNVVVRTDGTDTKKVQGSAVSIDDSGNVSGIAALSATTVELGHASDTTIARSGAGDIAIEGNAVYRAGGTDVPVTDGGTGASTAAAGFRALAEGVGSTHGDVLFRNGTQWTVLAAGTAGYALTSGGAGADVSWSDPGAGDVTAGAVMADNTIVRGDGGAKGVQDTGITIDDTDNVAGMATLTLPNTGLHVLDTNASHDLILAPGSDLTADRTFTITTGDADKTLDLTAGSMAPTTAGLAVVEAANVAAQTALFDAVVGDSGAGGTKGLVPAPAAGDAAAAKFLKADGTWTTPAGSGDMTAATYDAATVAEQLVGLTATQTLTNKTLTTPTLTLKQSATPTPTAEGDIQWDTDGNFIAVGDGASTQYFYASIDEDTMSSDSATRVPTQQSLVAYVGAQTIADPQYRLSLTSNTPVMASTVAATGTLYWTPYGGNVAWVYDGSSSWVRITPGQLSIALSGGTASRPHDVFLDYNGGTPQLVITAWTNDTTRATALTTQDGRYVLTGATDHLYLGTIYVDGSNQCQWSLGGTGSGGVAGVVDVWNYYNRLPWVAQVRESDDSWSYTTLSFRSFNNSAGNRVTFVTGVAEDCLSAMFTTWSASSGGDGNGRIGFGYDSTSALSGASATAYGAAAGTAITGTAILGLKCEVGRHYVQALEYGNGGASLVFIGDNGTTDIQSGIVVKGEA